MKKICTEFSVAVRVTLLLLLLCSGIYPLLVWGGGQWLFPRQANGSLLYAGPTVIGSRLIGQPFSGERYFHPRPSAAGQGYDANASGGSNLGPTSRVLYDRMAAAVKAYRLTNGLAPQEPVPADAVTASASGLDPHISPANAAIQARRVAQARQLSSTELRVLIDRATERPDWGIFGEARVNVLELNLELDRH